jgi:hypothetical protein
MSGWPAKRTLAALGIPQGTYYRWLKEESWAKEKTPVRPARFWREFRVHIREALVSFVQLRSSA